MTEIDYTRWKYPETDLEILDELNGYVYSIEEDTFWIIYTDSEGADLQAEVNISFLDDKYPEEKLWFNEGQYFRWRFMKNPDDPDTAIDEFVFYKRVMSKEEIEKIKKEADELFDGLKWD